MFKILGFIVPVLLCSFSVSAKVKIEKHLLPIINYVSIPELLMTVSLIVSNNR